MRENEMLLIRQIEGMDPFVSHMLKMMEYARMVTLNSVKGMSVEDLDYLHDGQSNSIGALLLHIASVEFSYQLLTFDGRSEQTESENAEWLDAQELGEAARYSIRGNSLDFYLEKLAAVRSRTVEEFRRRGDSWLMQETEMWGRTANHYFMWFHVCEDEINHRGQINWIRKRLPVLK